jgi:hypothetical protein
VLASWTVSAWAGDGIAARKHGTVIGISPDGTAYAWREVGVADEDVEDPCHYPALPEKKNPHEVVLYLCMLRGECDTYPIYDFYFTPTGNSDTQPCTPPQAASERLAKAKSAFAAAHIDLTTKAESLAVDELRMVTVPKAAMTLVGLNADVMLSSSVDTKFARFAWLNATADGFPSVRVQKVETGLAAEGLDSAWLLPTALWVVARFRNSRDWHLGRADVPLARLAVRLLTARAERDAKANPAQSRADLAQALKVDPTYEPAKKLHATLATAQPPSSARIADGPSANAE